MPAKLTYNFANPALRQRALSHRSTGADNNERLEFFGDALVNLLGFEDLVAIEDFEFCGAIAEGRPFTPGFAEAVDWVSVQAALLRRDNAPVFAAFVSTNEPGGNGMYVFALDIATGAKLWEFNNPYDKASDTSGMADGLDNTAPSGVSLFSNRPRTDSMRIVSRATETSRRAPSRCSRGGRCGTPRLRPSRWPTRARCSRWRSTRSGCWSSRRSPAGSTSAIRPGRMTPVATSTR